MSYTHDRDITLEGWIVHTSQANAKGTIKEHRNPILESRCKSKRGMKSELVPTNQAKLILPSLSSYPYKYDRRRLNHLLVASFLYISSDTLNDRNQFSHYLSMKTGLFMDG